MLDAVQYFFTNLLLHNILLGLISFLLGLLLGWLLWAKYKKQIDSLEAKVKGYESDISGLKTKNGKLEADLADCKANQSAGDDSQLKEELAACKTKCASLQSKVDSLGAGAATAAAAPLVVPASDTSSKSRAFFSSAIESGKMRDDETYGLLYNSAPDEVDDLTRIHGVAKVLNGTLNEFGVYTYRQIALWTPKICDDFSEKIAFPGRVERDDWIGQCKDFHKEKYGEDI